MLGNYYAYEKIYKHRKFIINNINIIDLRGFIMNKEEMIKDKLTKVCICRGITRATIKSCIKEGHDTLESIKKNTGAMDGGCKGNRCRSKIEEILLDLKKEN